MRRALASTALLGLALSAGLASAGTPSAVPPTPKPASRTLPKTPALTLVGLAPVTVSGWRFAPAEKVIVTLQRSPTPLKRTVVVDRNGRFFARFDGVRLPACSQPRVLVRSQRGTTVLKSALPNCRPSD